MSLRLPTTPLAASLLAGALALGGCRTAVTTAPGATAAPQAPAYAAPAETAPAPIEAYRTPDETRPQSYDMTPAVEALHRAVARTDGMRTLVYYNGRLSEQISAWHVPRRGVVELQTEHRKGDAAESGNARLLLYTEFARGPGATGRKNLDELLAEQLESRLVDAFLDADVDVVDKAFLYRTNAFENGFDDASKNEIAVLRTAVDVVVEVTFVLNPDAPEGYEVVARAIRTADASLLGRASSARLSRELGTETRTRAVAGKGFETEEVTYRATLEYLLQEVTADLMTQLARRW